ncbi:4'-phosphopantetheinyl transferase superfamily protein [Paraliobacillus sp. JSM ZJ581]|uniref:4'-phosphopantetheinyl transferase family protein n=1 Tax=Paraliobacillus sp. JSM ZJ581 TaxID=3342118 RepID=UPI0035A95A6B
MIEVFLFRITKEKNNKEKMFKKIGINEKDIKYSIYGKPYLQKSFISISASGKWFVIALSHKNIGIDIQCITKVKDRDFIRSICNADLSQRNFYKLWTRIESYLKFTGEGLNGIDSVGIDSKKLELITNEKDIQYYTKWIDKNHVLSVCIQNREKNILMLNIYT